MTAWSCTMIDVYKIRSILVCILITCCNSFLHSAQKIALSPLLLSSSDQRLNEPMGVYIHIPFCRRRCYYCDFPVVVAGDGAGYQSRLTSQYTKYLLKEIETFANAVKDAPILTIDTIYFGGGTPSLASDECKL